MSVSIMLVSHIFDGREMACFPAFSQGISLRILPSPFKPLGRSGFCVPGRPASVILLLKTILHLRGTGG